MNKIKFSPRLLVIAVILVAIGGIWFMKNRTAPLPVVTPDNPDFALLATELDLEALGAYQLPIMLNFVSATCPPCRAMEPDLIAIHGETLEKAIVKSISVDDHPEIAQNFPIQVTPTQLFITPEGTPYLPGEGIDIPFVQYNFRDSGDLAFTAHQGILTQEEMRSILQDMGDEG